jgi:hypothetical protein
MKNIKGQQEDKPFTARQLADAMAALGKYTGENTDAEHTAETARLGGMKTYRMHLSNALLGIVEVDAMLADSSGVSVEQMEMAYRQALISAGVEGHSGKLLNFLRWRTLRVEGPLREIAQNEEVGPLPQAAAHASEGLQLLLGVCAAGQNPEQVEPGEMITDLKAARLALTNAVANIDIMLRLLAQANDLFS